MSSGDSISASHTLSLRLDGGRRPLHALTDDEEDQARLSLAVARGVPLDVALRLGAVEADLDLGGLAVDELDVESAASSTSLRFATPNSRRMRSLRFDVGAASIEATGVGNANVEHVDVARGSALTWTSPARGPLTSDARCACRSAPSRCGTARRGAFRFAPWTLRWGPSGTTGFASGDGVHYRQTGKRTRPLTIEIPGWSCTLESERLACTPRRWPSLARPSGVATFFGGDGIIKDYAMAAPATARDLDDKSGLAAQRPTASSLISVFLSPPMIVFTASGRRHGWLTRIFFMPTGEAVICHYLRALRVDPNSAGASRSDEAAAWVGSKLSSSSTRSTCSYYV